MSACTSTFGSISRDNAASTIETQQRAYDDWITMFNYERPHEALGMKVPADVYRPSERRMSRYVVGGFPDGCTVTNACMTCCAGTLRHRVLAELTAGIFELRSFDACHRCASTSFATSTNKRSAGELRARLG